MIKAGKVNHHQGFPESMRERLSGSGKSLEVMGASGGFLSRTPGFAALERHPWKGADCTCIYGIHILSS
jgi:hypothetical protein